MGWVTLHSVAALYPEKPSEYEIALIKQWLDCFARTIVCPSCQVHFTKMLETYRAARPQMFNSRTEMMIFVLRAHNTVNRRLNKKVYTLEESEAIFKNWSPEYCRWQRNRYLQHIQRQWGSQVSMQGIVALTYVKQLVTAETGYWSTRTLDWSIVVSDPSSVTFPIVEFKPKNRTAEELALGFNPIEVLSAGNPRRFKFRVAKIPLSLISK